jgi:crotonobetaine/carnitine-CoA ligase
MVIFDDGVELSCAQFLEATSRLSAGLASLVNPGDQVGLAIGNRAEFLVAYYALLSHRAVAVLMGPSIGQAEADLIVQDRGLRLAIAEGAAADALEQAHGGGVRVLRVDPEAAEPHGLQAYSTSPGRPLENVQATPEDVIGIGFTSGTTGLPKALAFDHNETLRYADVVLRTLPFDSTDRFLCPLHFHYGDPLWMLLISVLRHTPLVVMRKFSVSRFWDVAARFEVTRLMSIGAIPSLLLQAPPSPAERAHRISVAIGVGVPRAQHAEMIQRFGFPWLEYYGMSETCVAIAMPLTSADNFVGTGALGIPVPEAQVRLISSDREVLKGEAVGELEVSGPWVPFAGYLGNPEATEEILHDGWVRTGDVMRRDTLGVYYFEGRIKEIIRRGGENIAPAQIEEVLRTHPAVVDAAVVAVPDPVRDEEAKAYVQISTEVTADELWDFCTDRLAPHKVPRYIEFRVAPFPRTPSERIRKQLLRVDGVHRIEGAWDRLAAAPAVENVKS